MNPRPRTSTTSGISATGSSSSRSSRIFGCRRSSVCSLLERLQAGERRRAGERVAGERVAVEEACACSSCGAEESLVDPLGRQRRGKRQVAAGQPLAEAEEVGRDALLLAGEHRPRAAEPGRDLVADQEARRGDRTLPHLAQVAGRMHPHPGRALDQRLDDHRRDLLAAWRSSTRSSSRGVARARTRWRSNSERAVGAVEERRSRRPRRRPGCRRGRRRAAKRSASGGVLAAALAASTGTPSSARPRSRSSPSRSRRPGSSPGGASSTRRAASSAAPGVGQPQHGRVGHPVELRAHGAVDRRVAVAVDVAPQRRDAVDVAPALGVDQVGALGPLDHQRLLAPPVAAAG